ncbi:MAG: hypothetical protein ABFC67_06220 [Mizugakiibacter sp.]|uniref:hypothetical protein n=1 Tax=Mizugakiibacter sp. TaxID=1972610 RepID=UPI0031C52778|nr:hypothetical protein [Xanthomonadaceae bacterium]
MSKTTLALACALAFAAGGAAAHGIDAASGNAKAADFDIVRTNVAASDRYLAFDMQVSGKAGATHPAKSGKLAGSTVFSYVWPTRIDTAEVGFDAAQGTLALAVTAHADFDDTPWIDENGDGNPDDDGDVWHSHWVVLVPDDACGKGMLKVKDIPEGAHPKLPATWPGLPILLDSPGYTPLMDGRHVRVRVPFRDPQRMLGSAFDGVTAGLRVNANVQAPLLCVVGVKEVASGDLSLPGRIAAAAAKGE